jgi:hypothetical protein
MPESSLHRRLVDQLVSDVLGRSGHEWLLLVDGEHHHSNGCPPQLASARPDVYARDAITKHVIIGEAKIAADLEGPHTLVQLGCYFDHLSRVPSGELIIPVPYLAAGAAYRICRLARRRAGCEHVPFEISGWLFGTTVFSQVWRG